MRTTTSLSSLLAIGTVLLPLAARAQCGNLTGNPAPTAEIYAANQVKLKYLATGPGFNDDKPELRKSLGPTTPSTFDPLTTDTVHVTFRLNSIAGATMWTTSIPPNASWVGVTLINGNVRWRYNDPLAPYGVKKAQIVHNPTGFFLITKLLGSSTNIANAPLLAGTDNVHVLVEVENGGTGFCYDGTTSICTGSGNTQVCRVI